MSNYQRSNTKTSLTSSWSTTELCQNVPVKTGLEVNGNNTAIHELAVGHTIQPRWCGMTKNGQVYYHQCELHYDYDFNEDFLS